MTHRNNTQTPQVVDDDNDPYGGKAPKGKKDDASEYYYYDRDPYHAPERFGLTEIGTLELDEADYSFDILAVWYHAESDSVYWAVDSGCSCPSPFEDYNRRSDLKQLKRDGRYGAGFNTTPITEVINEAKGDPDDEYNYSGKGAREDGAEFLGQVDRFLRGKQRG